MNTEIPEIYIERIRELEQDAELDNVALNQNSIDECMSFINSTPPKNYASIMLTSQGNARAVWRTDSENHCAFHFKGDQKINYVIFKRFDQTGEMVRLHGESRTMDLNKLIRQHQLESLLYSI